MLCTIPQPSTNVHPDEKQSHGLGITKHKISMFHRYWVVAQFRDDIFLMLRSATPVMARVIYRGIYPAAITWLTEYSHQHYWVNKQEFQHIFSELNSTSTQCEIRLSDAVSHRRNGSFTDTGLVVIPHVYIIYLLHTFTFSSCSHKRRRLYKSR